MKYLMFAQTENNDEFCQTLDAQNDDMAVALMKLWLRYYRNVSASEIVSIAGVWDKDENFYSANTMADLTD